MSGELTAGAWWDHDRRLWWPSYAAWEKADLEARRAAGYPDPKPNPDEPQGPSYPKPGDDPYPPSLRDQIAALQREIAVLRRELDMGDAAEPVVEDRFPARALAAWPGAAGGMQPFTKWWDLAE